MPFHTISNEENLITFNEIKSREIKSIGLIENLLLDNADELLEKELNNYEFIITKKLHKLCFIQLISPFIKHESVIIGDIAGFTYLKLELDWSQNKKPNDYDYNDRFFPHIIDKYNNTKFCNITSMTEIIYNDIDSWGYNPRDDLTIAYNIAHSLGNIIFQYADINHVNHRIENTISNYIESQINKTSAKGLIEQSSFLETPHVKLFPPLGIGIFNQSSIDELNVKIHPDLIDLKKQGYIKGDIENFKLKKEDFIDWWFEDETKAVS